MKYLVMVGLIWSTAWILDTLSVDVDEYCGNDNICRLELTR